MLHHALRAGPRGTRGARPSYRPTVERLEERALPSGTPFAAASHAVRRINAAAHHLLQLTATLAPQVRSNCGAGPTVVTQSVNLLNQVQAEAAAVLAHFRHGGPGVKHPGSVLRLENRLVGDLQGFPAAGGLPSAQLLSNLARDSGRLQRLVVAAFPQSIANACSGPGLPGALFGGGMFLF
jgi:hypothetical protein